MTTEASSAFEYRVAEAKLDLIIQQNLTTIFASNILVPSVVLGLSLNIGHSEPRCVVIWTLVIYLLAILRYLHHVKLTEFRRINRSAHIWEYELLGLSVFSGILWAICGIMFIDIDSLPQSLVAISAVFGVLAGAVPALASHTRVFLGFVFSVWIPPVIYFLYIFEPLYIGVAVFGTLFFSVNILFSRSQVRSLDQSIRLSFENSDLLEELQIQKQKAEDANSAKSKFLAAASHDLRQPIHAMRLLSDNLAMRIKETETADVMHRLRASIENLSGLFDSLLDISKLDARAIEPQIEGFNLGQLLIDLQAEFTAPCAEKQLRCRYRHTHSFQVRTDPVLLELIMRNLISNAIKYTSEGSVLVAARKRGDRVRIEIWDTGQGIPQKERDKIFDEFYQLDNLGNNSVEGIGLGLSIVRRLCELLGYDIYLRSVVNKGTVFFIELPFTHCAKASDVPITRAQQSAKIDTSDLNGVQILVIEDDENVRVATKQLLSGWGCNAIAAKSRAEAIETLDLHIPDIIISDYDLGESWTGDIIIDLLRNEVGYKIPGIIITGDTTPEILSEAKFPILHKPVNPELLRERIINLLNKSI